MVRTEDQLDLHVHHGEASEHASLEGIIDTLVNSGDVFLGNNAAGDAVDELIAVAGVGFNLDNNVTVLTATTRLLGVLEVRLGRLGDGFAVGNLGLAHVGVHVEFAGKAVNDDFQVQFAHTSDQGLVGFIVALHAEGRIFLGQLVQSGRKSVAVGLGLGLNGHFDNRIRNVQRFQDHFALFVAQGVAGRGVLEAHESNDVASARPFHVFTLVGVHLQDAADAFALAGVGVVHGHAGFEEAGVNTEEGQVTDEGVGEELEHQTGKGFLVVAMAFNNFIFLAGDVAGHGRDVHRRRQVVHHGVKQGLHAHVAEGRTQQHRHDVAANGGLADAGNDFFLGQRFAAKVLFEQHFVFFCHGFKHFVMLFVVQILHVGRHVFNGEFRTLGGLVKTDGLAKHQIYHAFKLVFAADGQLQGHGLGAQTVADHVHAAEEVGTDTVHLVHKADTRNIVAVSLTPHGFRLGFNTGNGVEHAHGTVEHAQRAFNFNGEVNVAGGVDDVDAAVFPEAGGGGRGNGDAAFLFLLHPVHGGGAVVRFANLVVNAGIKKNTFGGGSLACVNMGHNADIALFVYSNGAGHGVSSILRMRCGAKPTPLPCGRGVGLNSDIKRKALLPAVVSESLVRVGHAVRVFTLFHRAAATVESIQQFGGKLGSHALFTARTRIVDKPANRQGNLTFGAHFHGHLVGGTAHAAGLNFHVGLHVVQGLFKGAHGFFARLFSQGLKGAVENLFGCTLLAVEHKPVHKLGDKAAGVQRIGQHFPLRDRTFTGHGVSPSCFFGGGTKPRGDRRFQGCSQAGRMAHAE